MSDVFVRTNLVDVYFDHVIGKLIKMSVSCVLEDIARPRKLKNKSLDDVHPCPGAHLFHVDGFAAFISKISGRVDI